jgi:hypothetical protein
VEARVKTAPLDRRRSPRYLASDHGIVSARVRPGRDVAVTDVSARGALVVGRHRLMPGASVELQMGSEGRQPEVVRGRVVRCTVIELRSDTIVYRGAIAFDQPIRWLTEDLDGYGVPGTDQRSSLAARADVTQSLGLSALAALRARFL